MSGAQVIERQRQLMDSVRRSEDLRLAQQEVARPFVAGKTRPLAREATMPAALRDSMKVTALFQRVPVDLSTAMRQLSQATGLLVTATPDAALPPAMFAPRTAVTQAPLGVPPTVILGAHENAPIWQVFDDVARQIDGAWRPTSSGAEFYRVETRAFDLQGVATTAGASASLGRNNGQQTMFTSESRSGFKLENQNVLAGLKGPVDAMLTTGGRAVFSEEHQNAVITDTPAALDRIGEFIARRNRAMTRRVRVVIEAVEVTSKDNSDASIDWNIVYNVATAAVASSSPANMADGNAGFLSVSPNSGPFAGSRLVLKALSEVGTVVGRRSFPFITTSGKPVTHALRTTFNYIDQVQATVSTSAITTAVAPTVVQKDETVGTFVTIVPTAKDDGTIYLSFSFDVTQAQPLVPFTVGAGAAAVTVQQKTIDGQGVIEEVPVRSGQTVVIGGLEVVTGQDTERRLTKGAPILLGGADKSSLQRTQMVLLVTAVAEEAI